MPFSHRLVLLGLATLPLTLAGCQVPPTVAVPASGDASVSINADRPTGSLQMPFLRLPTLSEMQDQKPVGNQESKEEKLRAPALRDAALTYGVRGGLAWASQQINQRLNQRAGELTQTYNFVPLLIRAPSGQTLLPPVITESDGTYESSDAGSTLRIADRFYDIQQEAQFAPTAPLWHSYLFRSYKAPSPPPDDDLPKTDEERDAWKVYVATGWEQGIKQAQDIFKADLNRLNRDYNGMVRYSALLQQGQVTAPIVAESNMGITGTGKTARYNDRLLKITGAARLNVDAPDDIKSSVSTLTPNEAAAPPGTVPTAAAPDVVAPPPTRSHAARVQDNPGTGDDDTSQGY